MEECYLVHMIIKPVKKSQSSIRMGIFLPTWRHKKMTSWKKWKRSLCTLFTFVFAHPTRQDAPTKWNEKTALIRDENSCHSLYLSYYSFRGKKNGCLYFLVHSIKNLQKQKNLKSRDANLGILVPKRESFCFCNYRTRFT